jgi:hypothetical protein
MLGRYRSSGVARDPDDQGAGPWLEWQRRRGAPEASSPPCLGIPAESLGVLSHGVGGNFGTRNRVFVEFALMLWAASSSGWCRPFSRHGRHQYQQCGGALRVALRARASFRAQSMAVCGIRSRRRARRGHVHDDPNRLPSGNWARGPGAGIERVAGVCRVMAERPARLERHHFVSQTAGALGACPFNHKLQSRGKWNSYLHSFQRPQ